jgi:hypothetical protein
MLNVDASAIPSVLMDKEFLYGGAARRPPPGDIESTGRSFRTGAAGGFGLMGSGYDEKIEEHPCPSGLPSRGKTH